MVKGVAGVRELGLWLRELEHCPGEFIFWVAIEKEVDFKILVSSLYQASRIYGDSSGK